MLRINATGKSTIRDEAAAYTESLLNPQQPPPSHATTDATRPWESPAIWQTCLSSWNEEITKEVCALLATEAKIHKLIHKGKTNGAPGLDDIQYGVLKLMLFADNLAAKQASKRGIFTNQTESESFLPT